MRRRIWTASAVLAAALLTSVTGCASVSHFQRATPGATDRTCTSSLAASESYATRPSTVKTTKTASCVLKYVASFVPSAGFTRSVEIERVDTRTTAYGDDDGTDVLRTHGLYSAPAHAAYEVQDDHIGHYNPQGTDFATLRYLDQPSASVYTNTPQQNTGWAKTTDADAPEFLLDQAAPFPLRGLTIRHWTKAAANLRNTWTFDLSGTDTYPDTIHVQFVVASSGLLLSGSEQYSADVNRSRETHEFTATYGNAVPYVSIPAAVTAGH